MASSNVCWGIEVGSAAIKAVKLESAGESAVNVLDFAIIPHKKVLSTPDLDQNDALRVALGQFTNEVDLGGASAVFSVPGHSAFARFAKLPPVEPKKVPDIVRFEAVQQIPFPIDQVEWDYQTFVSTDSPEVEVGIFAITRDRVSERLALYQDVNLVPDALTLSPVAAYNAIAFDLEFGEKTPGTIILDIGTTSTDLVICEPGRMWIRTFPIGGHHFTDALVKAFQLTYAKAEKLKQEAENSKVARHAFQAMRPVFGDLAQDVQRSIGYYQSLHKDAQLTRLIGLGSTFQLPGLRKFLKNQLQMDVYRLEQFKRAAIEGPRNGEFQAQSLNLATAYGLALQGVGMAPLEVNLMPSAVIRQALWSKKTKWFGIAAGAAVLASGAMFLRPFMDQQAVAAAPRPDVIGQTLSELNSLKREAQEAVAPGGVPTATAAEYLSLGERREIFAHILDDAGSMLQSARERPPQPTGGAELRPEQIGFMLKDLKTVYEPPVTTMPDGTALDPAQATPARIRVDMTIVTEHPDAQRYVLGTVVKWLADNAKRKGWPYEIVTPQRAARLVSAQDIASAADPAGAEGQPSFGARGIEVGGESIAGAEAGLDERPRLSGRGGGRVRGSLEAPQGGEGGVIMTGESSSPEKQAADLARSQATAVIKRLAPLPGAPEKAPGTRISTWAITWEAVLVGPEKKAEEGENPGGGS